MTEAIDLAGRRLLVLGAGRHQETLIQRAEERGVAVVAVDYYPDAPGQGYASHPELVDALDVPANIELAERYRRRRCGDPGNRPGGRDDGDSGRGARAALLPHAAERPPRHRQVGDGRRLCRSRRAPAPLRGVSDVANTPSATRQLTLPVVVKPADSQGQRATVRVDHRSGLAPAVADAIAESRTGRAIVDEWVTGPEVTVSAWVSAGGPHILMVADRITINPPPTVGVAFQHVFPSLAAVDALPEMERQIAAVTRAYGMREGPLYVQMIVNGGDTVTIEGGARVGGGHEVGLTPIATGVDVVDRLIDLALTGEAEPVDLPLRSVAATAPRPGQLPDRRPRCGRRCRRVPGYHRRGSGRRRRVLHPPRLHPTADNQLVGEAGVLHRHRRHPGRDDGPCEGGVRTAVDDQRAG